MANRRSRRRVRRLLPNFFVIAVLFFLAAMALLAYQLILFSQTTDRIPANVVVAGINVGGMTPAEARIAWERAYAKPLILYYNDSPILLDPAVIGFRLNVESMVASAQGVGDAQTGSWVSQFYNHLTHQEIVQSATLPLSSDYQQNLLEGFLRDIAARYDRPPGQPTYDVQTLATFPGEEGYTINIDQAIQQIDFALRNPVNRTVNLPIGGENANQPSLDVLKKLLIDYLDSVGFIYDGQTTTAGIFILDLQTGEELNMLGDVAFSAASTQKVAILIDYFHYLSTDPTQDDAWLMANSLLCSDNGSSNLIMEVIGGGNIFNGIASVTETMQITGARNSFISAPFAEPGRELGSISVAPTNPNADHSTDPDPFNQITAEDMGTLFNMIYDCANYGSGLMTAFSDGSFTQQECQRMLNLMSANDLERLLQGGIPPEVTISHKNGWLNTQAVVGDAGIVFPPNGRNYVIVVYLWKDSTTEEATAVGFQQLWPLVEEISRAVWNYFAPQEALYSSRSLPETARDCEQNGYLPPYGEVNLDDINAWREGR